ncbi:glycosyltransferase [Sinomonas sp. ASV486]|uniref:glycosyltransferase n=1 Tax=Sinomonas sp. ASV486 TaxID=3051170 RepID=UPI0027DD31A7|nr:glycosyltransferase [Sinomonas sp. ASV486]MDQ4488843.1 glycosyltransferase [Sinomonas sp. ASV486]
MTSVQKIYIATNNGDIGGGEVMLLGLAATLGSLGFAVTVVGPRSPIGVLEAAQERGFAVISLDASERIAYMRSLRAWRKDQPDGVLWCNGLVPAAATAGLRNRVVHLHQMPSLLQRPMALAARIGALATLVPSRTMARGVARSTVLHNWSPALERVAIPRGSGPVRLGFLGRPSEAKGIHILADAFDALRRQEPDKYRLRVAGEPRFVDARERAFVESRMRSLGTSADRLGWMPADEFFGTIDILIVPSVVEESFGLVATEAMSARVPVIVSDAGALPEVVGPDHPWIARAGDGEDLVRAVKEAVAALPADDVVERAHERWKRQFSPEAGRERLRDLLDQLGLSPEGPQ